MALDFAITENKRDIITNGKWVSFSDKIRAYLSAHKCDFSNGITILLALDEYGDTLLYKDKMEQLIKLCAEIQESTNDYSIFSKCKPLGVKKDELQIFSSELSSLLQFAMDNEKLVIAVGD